MNERFDTVPDIYIMRGFSRIIKEEWVWKKPIKLLLAALVLGIIVLLTQCSGINKHIVLPSVSDNSATVDTLPSSFQPVRSMGDRDIVSFETAADMCTDIIVATFINKQSYPTFGENSSSELFTEYEFSVDKILKGETTTNSIYLFDANDWVFVEGINDSYQEGNIEYVAGEKYLLFLERHICVDYDHDQYLILGDLYMSLSSLSESTMYSQPISEHSSYDFQNTTTEDLLLYIEDIAAKSNSRKYYGKKYSISQSIPEIIAESEQIFKVTVDFKFIEGVYIPIDTYFCTVNYIYKGDVLLNDPEYGDLADSIQIGFPKGSVKEGEEYIVLLNRVSEGSTIYSRSSKEHSVYDKDSFDYITKFLDEQLKTDTNSSIIGD